MLSHSFVNQFPLHFGITIDAHLLLRRTGPFWRGEIIAYQQSHAQHIVVCVCGGGGGGSLRRGHHLHGCGRIVLAKTQFLEPLSRLGPRIAMDTARQVVISNNEHR